jgi:hypothetical protein
MMSIHTSQAEGDAQQRAARDAKFTQDDVDRIVGERLARDRQARVTHEPRTYALHSPHSYYADRIAIADREAPTRPEALQRLADYGRELVYEIDHGTVEGRRAERIFQARTRVFDEAKHRQRMARLVTELRATGTDGGVSASAAGEAAALVSPAFLADEWAPYRGAARSFADQCRMVPLPPYGMQVYIPYFSSGAKTTEQTESGTVTETVPAAALEGAEVKMLTGQLTVGIQLRDRGMMGGGSMDVVLGLQCQQQLDEAVDKYVLNQAITKGTAITGKLSGTFKASAFWEDLATAREEITDTAGTRLRPTHAFTTSDFYSYVSKQVDSSSERPLMLPEYAPGFPITNGADSYVPGTRRLPKWSRFMGNVLPGGVLWFTDDNIPNFGTTSNSQLLVSAPGEAILLMEDEPILTPFVETKANTLQVVLNLRQYTAAITRHAAGTSVLSSSGYATSKK